jgi:hypothetical protein
LKHQNIRQKIMAVREGFEPSVGVNLLSPRGRHITKTKAESQAELSQFLMTVQEFITKRLNKDRNA